jgi:mono/diheme cytochrome c family protein
MKAIQTIIACGTVSLIAFAADDKRDWKLPPETAKLERGDGVEIATAQCIACHSLDYISTQPRMNRAGWTATVTKMKEKYGAPIASEQMEKLVNYLVKTYGAERSDPAPK